MSRVKPVQNPGASCSTLIGFCWDKTPKFLFDLFPPDWLDPNFLPHLQRDEGRLIEAVRMQPAEFIRDEGRLLAYLERKAPGEAAL